MSLKSQISVVDCDKAVLKKMITENHYSRRCSPIKVGYGVWFNGLLSGGIIFSSGVGRDSSVYFEGAESHEIIELTRLWLAPSMPRNSESVVIGRALRHLRRNRGKYKGILSYADETAGHVGYIYQATNFYYLGTATAQGKIRIGNRLYAKRSISGRMGTASVPRLKEILCRDDIEWIMSKRKHVYVYPLDDAQRPAMLRRSLPYPKKVETDDGAVTLNPSC